MLGGCVGVGVEDEDVLMFCEKSGFEVVLVGGGGGGPPL